MVTFPPCKINLGLNILSKRSDGYHDIETCFYAVPWTDVLEIIPATQTTFTSSGISIPGNPAENLCLKAYHLLQQDFDLEPVNIHLHKVIPTGAGLGGGSSDAANTLLLLNNIFSLKLSPETLRNYASQLGSDCAFFINANPMIGSGRGEVLTSIGLTLKGKFLVLVKPDIHVTTAEAYAGVKPNKPATSVTEIISTLPVQQWRDKLVNDFEHTVFAKHPAIKTIKEELYRLGAIYASMSGSGSCVFGLFDEEINPADHFSNCICWKGWSNS